MHAMMGSQVKSLLLIASQLSGYPIPADPPPVVTEVTRVEMAIDECGGGDPLSVLTCPLLGFYEWPVAVGENPKIPGRAERLWILDEGESEESANAIAVHELTHWLQWHNGFHPTQCPELFQVEYQAYTVTLKYKVMYENYQIPEAYGVPGVSCPTQPEKTK